MQDRPLGEVIAALRAYRTGFVRISPEAAALKVYGSYPLDDSAAALASIAETLPVAVHVHPGGWLVRIELA
ncbi:fec operon regulator FecR [compost metagenome]